MSNPNEEVQKEEEFEEAQGNFAKFLNPGDTVTGTFVGLVQIPAKGIFPPQVGYNLVVDGAETTCAFNLSKKWIHSAMKGAKYGQRIKFVFDSWFETEAYKKELAKCGGDVEKVKISRAKTIKVFLGKMDTAFLDGFNVEDAINGEQ